MSTSSPDPTTGFDVRSANAQLFVAATYIASHRRNGFTPQGIKTRHKSRIAKTLEALVALTVSRPGIEKVAMALQVQKPAQNHSITMIMAANNAVDMQKARSHVEIIWASLRRLSHIYHYGKRASSGAKDRPDSGESCAAKIYYKYVQMEQGGQDAFRGEFWELRQKLYDYSAAKIECRLRKVLLQLVTYTAQYLERRDMERIRGVFVALLRSLEKSREQKVRIDDMVVDDMWAAHGNYDKMPTEVRAEFAFIEKAFFVEINACPLLALVFAERLRFCLDETTRFEVQVLENPPVQDLPVPVRKEDWKIFVGDTLAQQSCIAADPEILDRVCCAAELATASRGGILRMHYHCELTLARHIWGLRSSVTSKGNGIISWLAVSKRSCVPCYKLLRAMAPEVVLVTKGCHGRTHWSWMFPEGLTDDVRKRFCREMVDHFCEVIRVSAAVRDAKLFEQLELRSRS